MICSLRLASILRMQVGFLVQCVWLQPKGNFNDYFRTLLSCNIGNRGLNQMESVALSVLMISVCFVLSLFDNCSLVSRYTFQSLLEGNAFGLWFRYSELLFVVFFLNQHSLERRLLSDLIFSSRSFLICTCFYSALPNSRQVFFFYLTMQDKFACVEAQLLLFADHVTKQFNHLTLKI